jgi:hypothetical protein
MIFTTMPKSNKTNKNENIACPMVKRRMNGEVIDISDV